MKHRYYDVIMAWAEDKCIQYRVILNDGLRSPWVDLNECSFDKKSPNFDAENVEWRIKPTTKIIKYRLALMRHRSVDYYMAVFNNSEKFLSEFNNLPYFVKWVSDWIDHEVEE